MSNLRIAWLLTSAFYYWHPMLNCLARLMPETTAFVANWRGYAPGYEDSFAIDIVGERRVISLIRSETSYGSNFTHMPLNIINRLLQFKPTVIFSNSFGVWTLLALLSKWVGGWRVIIAYEGSSPGVDYLHSPIRLALRRLMVGMADACITNSKAGMVYLTNILRASPAQVFLHPYEVPAANAMVHASGEAQLAELPHQRPIFLFVGSLNRRKGVDLLLNACAYLKQQGCTDYTLWIVGDGPQRQELESFCDREGLTDCVKWVGRVDYGDLGAYFQQADVFVLPTLEDTWGMVVLEAMVMGKAVLCSKFAGAAELVTTEENGFVVDPQVKEEIASAMGRFIAEPGLSDLMGERSAQIMMQYTPEAAAEFMVQVATFVLQPAG